MIPNAVSLPSLPSLPSIPAVNSLGSLASISSLGLGLACAATTVSGSVIPVEAGDSVGREEDGNVAGDEGGERVKDPENGSKIRARQGGDGSQGGQAQVITTCTVPGTAALTFDDGPYQYTEEISRVLRDNNATGTFFFNGQNFECINSPANAARVKAAYDAGHQVASHTWGHKDLATLSKDEILSEMSSVSQAIQQITGVRPAQMRPPFGSINDAVLEAAAQIGEDVVLWNLDSGDSSGTAPEESKSRYTQAAQQNSPILALNHETHETSVTDVLPAAIQTLKDAGYRLVTVAECTGREPYLTSDAPALPPSNLNCG